MDWKFLLLCVKTPTITPLPRSEACFDAKTFTLPRPGHELILEAQSPPPPPQSATLDPPLLHSLDDDVCAALRSYSQRGCDVHRLTRTAEGLGPRTRRAPRSRPTAMRSSSPPRWSSYELARRACSHAPEPSALTAIQFRNLWMRHSSYLYFSVIC